MIKIIISLFISVFLLVSLSQQAEAGRKRYSDRYDVRKFARKVADEHQMNRAELLGFFRQAKRQQSALDAMSKPAERKLTWAEYRPIFVTENRAKGGVEFWTLHADSLKKAEQQFGVPAEIIVAIIGVETRYGQTTGRYPVFDSLTTLGFDGKNRQGFFLSELEAFLLLSRDEEFNPLEIKGSYAGAMGIPQFISSSYRAYAVDFDNDGSRNLLTNPVDAIGSVGNYFARHGWQAGELIIVPAYIEKEGARDMAVGRGRQGLKPELTVGEWLAAGIRLDTKIANEKKAVLIELEKPEESEYWLGLKNFYVITRYNKSSMYAMAVYQLGNLIKQYYELAQESAVAETQ